MAEMYDITCSPSSGPSDEISLLLNHLLASSSSSSFSLPSVSNKPKDMPFTHFPPSSSSDGTFGLAAGNSTGLFPNSGWKILSYVNAPLDDHRHRNSTAELTGALDPSVSLVAPSSGEYNPVAADKKEADGTLKISSSNSLDCHAAAVKRRNAKIPVDSDFDDFDCESEEGVEASEEPSKPVPSRPGLKRSRAAEVHNLSEKRRRSRINEKMKALQNLIPNSNKTDKASMLDEAIEYLKQLQLQVQMLSMRNGMSLHPLYLPGPLQPFQLPQMRVGFGAGNSLLHMNAEPGMLAMNHDSSNQTTFSLSNQQPSSHHPIVMPGTTNITNAETSFGLDSSQAPHGPFQLSTVPEELFREGILSEHKLDISHSAKNPSEASICTSIPLVISM